MAKSPADDRPVAISHVVTSIDNAAAGPSHSVPGICRGLAAIGMQPSLFALTLGQPGLRSADGYDTHALPVMMNAVGAKSGLWPSTALAPALRAIPCDIIHAHGLWQLPLIAAGRVATCQNTPLVVAPRGMLHTAALAFSPRKKRAFDLLLQRRIVLRAAMVHATSAEEVEDARRYGFRGPVALVPNGIDLPPPSGPKPTSERRVLTLGRIHPKKGLDRLLRAWRTVETATPNASLQICGPDEGGHARELESLIRELGLQRVTIAGPVFGAQKDALYAGAHLFVLPTLGENFAMTVAESLAAGTPVVATRGAPWAGLEREGCGWWIDHGVAPLAAALTTALSHSDDALAAMGAKGRQWMARDFAWPALAHDLASAYRWLLKEGERPAHVFTA